MWTEEQLRMLIDERKNNNEYYHTLHEGRKMIWWGLVLLSPSRTEPDRWDQFNLTSSFEVDWFGLT